MQTFLNYRDSDAEQLATDFRTIMALESDVGLVFDLDALAATAIREEMEYGGIPLKTAAYLERRVFLLRSILALVML